MKKKVTWLGLSLLMVAAMLLASCGTSNKTSTPTNTATTSKTGEGAVLTVTNGNTIKTYTLADLQAFTPVTGSGGTILMGLNSYQGVALTDLLNAVGGITEGESVTVKGRYSYSATFTYDQITNDSFNFYDTSGNPVTPTTKPVLTVIYWANGVLLVNGGGPMGISGPTELGIISTQNLVSDNSLWIGSLTEIDIIPTP